MTVGGIIGAVLGGLIGAFMAWAMRDSTRGLVDRVAAKALAQSPDFASKEVQFRKQMNGAIAAVLIVVLAYFGWRSFG